VIVQELLKRPSRYNQLLFRLPGIGTSVLTHRLRTLERAAVVTRRPGPVGGGVVYALTARGRALDCALRELRRWGAGFLADPTADGSPDQRFDISYVRGIHDLADGEFELTVDGEPTAIHFTDGRLHQQPGHADGPDLAVRTSSEFLNRWAAGEVDWDGGRATGEVVVDGPESAWPRWLAATGYLPSVDQDAG
jgi:DNA-binding HxlR family transcriptional regulator